MRQAKRFTILLSIIALIVTFSSCSKVASSSSKSKRSSRATTVESSNTNPNSSTSATAQTSTGAASAQSVNFDIILNDVPYSLPAPYSEFTKNGWQCEALGSKILHPNVKTLYYDMKNGDMVIQISLTNTGETSKPLTECSVSAVKFNEANFATGTSLKLASSISIGSSYAETMAMMGQPTNSSETGQAKYIFYEQGVNQKIKLEFSPDDDLIKTMEIENLVSKNNLNSTATPTSSIDENIANALGNTWKLFNIRYGQAIYQLPIPVSKLLKNGWTLAPEQNKTIKANKAASNIEFKKDGLTLITDIKNYSSSGVQVQDCYVTQMIYDRETMTAPFELAKGITEKSTLGQLEAAYGESDKTFSSANENTHAYGTEGARLTVIFSGDYSKLIRMELQYVPDKLN